MVNYAKKFYNKELFHFWPLIKKIGRNFAIGLLLLEKFLPKQAVSIHGLVLV